VDRDIQKERGINRRRQKSTQAQINVVLYLKIEIDRGEKATGTIAKIFLIVSCSVCTPP
jgi:hypothetical protein